MTARKRSHINFAAVNRAAMTARTITQALSGRWHGTYGTARCPAHEDRNPSLKLRDDPDKRDGVDLHCFAGCDWRAVKQELQRQGLLSDRGAGGAPSMAHCRSQTRPKPRAQDADRGRFARDIWAKSRPAPRTIVEIYLKGRGITAPIPPTLRYHPGLKHRPTGLYLPAMVAGVSMVPDRKVVAIHRTFLRADGKGKAPVSSAKMMLGACGGGAVRLAAAGPKLGITEGIETGLTVMQEVPGLPVWAALSAGGIVNLVLPHIVTAVLIFADNDPAGIAAAERAAEKWSGASKRVSIATPPNPGQDFNDTLERPDAA